MVTRGLESGKSVFHFVRLKVQTSNYSASQIILFSIISNNTGTLEHIACEQAIFSPNREPVHRLWNVPLRSI